MTSIVLWIDAFINVFTDSLLSFHHQKNHSEKIFQTGPSSEVSELSPLRNADKGAFMDSCFAALLPEDYTGQPQLCQTLTPVKTQIACAKKWQSDCGPWVVWHMKKEANSLRLWLVTEWITSVFGVWHLCLITRHRLLTLRYLSWVIADTPLAQPISRGPSQWSTTNQSGPDISNAMDKESFPTSMLYWLGCMAIWNFWRLIRFHWHVYFSPV